MIRDTLSLYLHKPGLDTRFVDFPQGVFFLQRGRTFVRSYTPLTHRNFTKLVEGMRPGIFWNRLLNDIGHDGTDQWTWFPRMKRVHTAMLHVFPPEKHGFEHNEGAWIAERLRFCEVLLLQRQSEWCPQVRSWPLFHNLLVKSMGLRLHEQIEFMDFDHPRDLG